MTLLKKRIFRWVLGLTLLIGLIALAPFVLFSERFEDWAKNTILPILKEYHPVGHIREEILSLRNQIHNPQPSKVVAGMPMPVGFSGNRAEETRGLVSWIAPFSKKVPPDDRPPSGKIHSMGQSRALSLVGLKGETLSFQLVLRSDESMENLTASLVFDGNSSCLTVHRFLEYYLRVMVHTGSKYGPLVERVSPDPLVPFHDPYDPGRTIVSSVSLKSATNQPLWFDVHIDRRCMAGAYKGILEVRSSGRILRKSPVNVTVLDAILPKKVDLDRWMELFIGRLKMGEMNPNEQSFERLINRYFLMAHQYGFATNPSGDILPGINWNWNTGKPRWVRWIYYDRIYTPYLSGALTGSPPNVFCLPIVTGSLGLGWWGGFMTQGPSPTPIEEWKGIPDIATRQLARAITQHWQEKGWPIKQTFAFPFDEPMHQIYISYIYKLIANVNTALHEGSDNKIRVMLTDAPYIWDKKQAGHDKRVMYDTVDIWAPSPVSYIPDEIAFVKKRGARTWFYQSGAPFIGASTLPGLGIGFRMWFWTAWKYHVNGVFNWASDFWPGNSRASNAFKRQGDENGVVFFPGHQLHFIGYPDIDGPVPSIRMAQWRRGYEDYKYFVMLKAKGRGAEVDRIVNSFVHKALDDGGYIPYWRNPLWLKPGAWNHDPVAWHRIRVKMAREIADLYRSGG